MVGSNRLCHDGLSKQDQRRTLIYEALNDTLALNSVLIRAYSGCYTHDSDTVTLHADYRVDFERYIHTYIYEIHFV